MAEMVRTEPGVADLDAIADCIALDVPDAARQRVRRVFDHVEQLAAHPDSGSKPSELKGWRYRQLVNRRAGSSSVTIAVTSTSTSCTSCARNNSCARSDWAGPLERDRVERRLRHRTAEHLHGLLATPAPAGRTYSSNTARSSVGAIVSPFSARSASAKNFSMRGSPFGSGLVVKLGCAAS